MHINMSQSLLVAGRLSFLVELTGIDGSLFDLSSLDLKVENRNAV